MSLNMIEVVKVADRWQVRRILRDVPPATIVAYVLKKNAMLAGRAVAIDTNAELVIKDRKGRIMDRKSYGYDNPEHPG